MIMGMIWTLILRYQIKLGDHDSSKKISAKEFLMGWANQFLKDYPDLAVKDFHTRYCILLFFV